MPACATDILYVDSDMLVQVKNLRNKTTGSLISDATITASLTTLADVDVAGSPTPFSVPAVAGVPGTYRATLSKDFTIVAGTTYKLKIEIDGGTGLFRTETLLVEARDA